ncbi:MAG: glycosyltransferase [Aquificaceae bacterium]|jgi:glycosyltransferase involved in cell wall biosynthesis|uniref:glycosyltransferase n=1 Tax=Hydrogenobacter sp. Uz 6-8 TaxID=3384828 RepID=UPI000F1CB787|nr:MAG: glycosyltransferase family 1 protein [Aquificota bacterium]
MKLVDITPYFHSRSGGIRRYLLEKTKYLQQRGVEHVLIVPGRERRTYCINATRVYELPSFPLPLTGGYRFFSSFSEIREILQREEPDVVELGGTYQPVNHLKSERYLLSVFYHSDIRTDLSLLPAPERLRKALLEHTIKKKLSRADMIITPSRVQEEFLKASGLENVVTVNLGVDTDVFNPSKRDPYFDRALGIGAGKFKLLYSGRLSPDKNVDLLLEVFQHLDPTLFHLVVAGDGPARKKVEKLTQKLPNLTYLGYLHREEELARVYASCDVFVSTSCGETYGLAFLEAQACGCLLVAFDMGLETQPFKEFLVREPTLEAFYDAIIHACNALSLSNRERLSSYVQRHFSWESTFDRLLGVYRGVLAQV